MTIDPRAALNDLAHSLRSDSEKHDPSVANDAHPVSKEGSNAEGSVSGTLRIVSLLPSELALKIGEVEKFTITIDPVQTKDTEIPITVDPPDLVKISATVRIPTGKTDQTFYIERIKAGDLSVAAKLNGSMGQATVNMGPIMLLTYRPWYRMWGRKNIPLSSNKTVRNIQCASDSLLGSFLILLILFLAAYLALQYTDHQATLPIVLLFGALGSFISQQRRLKEFSDEDFELFNFSTIYKWLSPVGGAVLAGILYLMFIGDLLAGDIFPSFLAPQTDQGKPRVSGIKVIFEIGSPIPGDYAKLLFWSFVAGYSERFVTDILGRFETHASGEKLGKADTLSQLPQQERKENA